MKTVRYDDGAKNFHPNKRLYIASQRVNYDFSLFHKDNHAFVDEPCYSLEEREVYAWFVTHKIPYAGDGVVQFFDELPD